MDVSQIGGAMKNAHAFSGTSMLVADKQIVSQTDTLGNKVGPRPHYVNRASACEWSPLCAHRIGSVVGIDPSEEDPYRMGSWLGLSRRRCLGYPYRIPDSHSLFPQNRLCDLSNSADETHLPISREETYLRNINR